MKSMRFRSFSSMHFCFLCDATQTGELGYIDFEDTARHRSTLMSHEQYLLACAEAQEQPSFLLRCPGLRLEHVAIDSMHSGDLGVFADAIGGLLECEISNRQWHPNREEGLRWVNEELGRYYRANPQLSKATPLARSQLHSGSATKRGYPTLKCKATQCRHMCDFALTLAWWHHQGTPQRAPFRFRDSHRLRNRSEEHTNLMVRMFDALVAYHRSCDEQPFVPERCRDFLLTFLRAMRSLHDLWREGTTDEQRQHAPFHMRPKAHLLHHLAMDQLSRWGSPSGFWCYGDENFVGMVKTISVRTRHPATMEERVMEELMLGIGLRQ